MGTLLYEGYKYAGYPFAHLYADKNGSKGSEKIHQLIFGDWVGILKPLRKKDNYLYVHVRGETGWMHEDDLMDEAVLEIVFVDVGQGDGALIVTPNDEHIIIDTGIGANMHRYLRWRYNGFKNQWTFRYGIASHPDQDHYMGFHYLLNEGNVFFQDFLHNGLLEHQEGVKDSIFGEMLKTDRIYYTELFDTQQKIEAYLADTKNWEHPQGNPIWDKPYAVFLKRLIAMNKVSGDIRMCSSDDKYLQGFGPEKELNIRILGPVTETVLGKRALRSLSSTGKTKNGHSLVFKLSYRDIDILLGGDLNSAAETHLLEAHTGLPLKSPTQEAENILIDTARQTFQADIAKACHHGSADFTSLFLKSVNAVATIISSGDEEQHSHPRPDTLGAIGVNGRGERPLIFSTELARSHRENEEKTLREITELEIEMEKATSTARKDALNNKIKEKNDKLKERNVTVYGSINVRTDGRRCIIAQKLEKGGKSKVWDIYRLEKDQTGQFRYVPN
tara:strand:+ start:87471 stop:88979 length:1509 start_codon:yes stop_codon:yes gene_type:complete